MADLDIHNRFGPLAQLEATLSQLLLAIRPQLAESPTHPCQSGPDAEPAGIINGEKALRMATEDPRPSVNSKLSHPYKDALARRGIIASVPIQTKKASYWKKRGEMPTGDDRHHRSVRIRQKLEALRASSSPNHPGCFRCGDKGHLAPDCRNAILCFLCNRLGHKARWCKSILDLPPAL